jgi:gamma-glutamylputrescine oxidase
MAAPLADRMNKHRRQWGTAPWSRPAHSFSRTAPSGRPDVAIVGGGLTGVSTAYHLATKGTRAVLFEAGLIGDGASGRTGGLVLEGTAVGVLDQVDRCVPGLRSIVEREEIDCDLSLPGCWEIVHDKNAKRQLPWSDDGQPIGIASTVSGGVVQPEALTIGIANAAERLGAVLLENAPVLRINFQGELCLELDGEKIYPGYVVVATNAWINATLAETPPLHSSLTYACITAPLTADELVSIGMGDGIPFYTKDLPYLWGRTVGDGRMIFGAGLTFGDPASLEGSDIHKDDPAATLSRLSRRLSALHPVLRKSHIEASWAGPIAFTDSTVPLLGRHPANPRIFVSGAYAGHGVALSVRAGDLMAASIHDNQPLPGWGTLSR